MATPTEPADAPACLPGEEPLVELDTWHKAGRAVVAADPDEDPPT